MHKEKECLWIRDYIGMSVGELAAMCGVRPEKLEAIEAGEQDPTVDEIEVIATALGICPEHVLMRPKPTPEDEAPFMARAVAGLSPRDVDELKKFATFLRARAGKKRNDTE